MEVLNLMLKLGILLLSFSSNVSIAESYFECSDYEYIFRELDNYHEVIFKGPEHSGGIKYNKETNQLFYRSPFSFGSQRLQETNKVSRAISCVLENFIKHYDIKIPPSIITNALPKYNVCRGATYYLEEGSDIQLRKPSSIEDPATLENIRFAQKAGYFDEWDTVANRLMYEIAGVSPDWIEKTEFISGNQFLSDYGGNGGKIRNYCSFSEEKLRQIKIEIGENIYPYYFSKLEVTFELLK